MACRPATPAPITSTLAGGTVPGRRHEHGEELGQVLGGRKPRPVARHGGLRGQGVHGLRPADARKEVEAVGRGAPGGQGAHGVELGSGLQEADEGDPVGQLGCLLGCRWLHPGDQGGAGEGRGGIGGDRRTGAAVLRRRGTGRRRRLRSRPPPRRLWRPALAATSGTMATRVSPGRDSPSTASFTARGIQAIRAGRPLRTPGPTVPVAAGARYRPVQAERGERFFSRLRPARKPGAGTRGRSSSESRSSGARSSARRGHRAPDRREPDRRLRIRSAPVPRPPVAGRRPGDAGRVLRTAAGHLGALVGARHPISGVHLRAVPVRPSDGRRGPGGDGRPGSGRAADGLFDRRPVDPAQQGPLAGPREVGHLVTAAPARRRPRPTSAGRRRTPGRRPPRTTARSRPGRRSRLVRRAPTCRASGPCG